MDGSSCISLVLLAVEPLLTSISSNGIAGVPIAVYHQPMATSPYIAPFSFKNLTSALPFVLSPSPLNNRTVWVLAVSFGSHSFSQIINFTIGSKPQVALNLTNDESASIVGDNKGRLWFPVNNTLAFYDTTTMKLQVVASYPGENLQYIAVDGKNRVWVSLIGVNQLAMYDPSNPQDGRTFNIPTSGVLLQGIAVAPDGGIWFADPGLERLGRLDPNTLKITEYASPLRLIAPTQLTVAPNGLVWFTDHGSNEFGSFNPLTGEWTKFPVGYCPGICSVTLPNAIALDAQGKVWFSEHFAGRIARYDPDSGLLTEYIIPIPAGSPGNTLPYAWWARPSSNNLVWFTAFGLGEIGYVNSSIPVPLSVSSVNQLRIPRGRSAQLPVTVGYSGTGQVSVGITPSYLDVGFGTRLVSGSFIPNAQTGNNLSMEELTIGIAWSIPLGTHYIAVTASDGQVATSRHVILTITENLLPYPALAQDLVVLLAASFFYIRHRRRAFVSAAIGVSAASESAIP